MSKFNAFYLIPLLFITSPSYAASNNPQHWASVNSPSTQSTQSIGTYTAGCISGAKTLPIDGAGYQVMRLSRNRYYGHSHLIDFIQTLGSSVASEHGSSLLIGDLGQARGGPTPSGHRSHQTGLDVDIWFLLLQGKPQRVLSEQERETWGATSMLSGNGIDAAQWTATHEKILATAASLAHVERIFVNPLIKRELCHNALDNNREWLRKIRPWWHHDDHFHVRLSCPEDNKHCTHQDPLPAGDGCGADLAWWFSAEANAPAKKPAAPPKAVELPALCEQVLQEQ